MPAPNTRLVRVTTATRAGGPGSNQDRVFTTDNAVIVLDGASQPEPAERDGGWMAEVLGRELKHGLEASPGEDLVELLYDGIDTVARRYELIPGQAPSTTVSITRWSKESLEVLALGDSPVVVFDCSGAAIVIQDDRLKQSSAADCTPAVGFSFSSRQRWQELVQEERKRQNTAYGYWIAEASPEAALHALRRVWLTKNVAAVLAITDGIFKGIERYHVPPTWFSALRIATQDPNDLIDIIHEAEASDPDGVRWPRSKRHDDKTVALTLRTRL